MISRWPPRLQYRTARSTARRGRQGCITSSRGRAEHLPAISRPGAHMRRGEALVGRVRRAAACRAAVGRRAIRVPGDAGRRSGGYRHLRPGSRGAVGVPEGLPFEGVLRFAFPWPGFTPCTWLTTLSRDDLIERAGAVSAAKLSEIDDALRASEQRTEWTPAAVARLSEIKDSLRRRTQADGEGTDAHADEGRSRPHDRRSAAPQQQDHDLRLEY